MLRIYNPSNWRSREIKHFKRKRMLKSINRVTTIILTFIQENFLVIAAGYRILAYKLIEGKLVDESHLA